MTTKTLIILADGFEEIEAVVPLDILRRAGFDVTVASLGDRLVTGSHGISIQADQVWSDVSRVVPDLLVLPGGMPGSKNLGEHAGLRVMTRNVAESGGILAAICAAPAFTLGAWGFLSGRRATCYPGCEEQFPDDAVPCEDCVVVDGKIVTARGPGVAHDFAFALVEAVKGADFVQELRSSMQYRN